jgi:hypothetical protein
MRSEPPHSRPDRDALTVAMTVVPGLYSRNKMFGFYKDPEVRAATARAATLRGIVRQLASSHSPSSPPPAVELDRSTTGPCVLTYRVERLRLVRTLDLTPLEVACVAYLVARAGSSVLRPTEHERALLDNALGRLSLGLHLAGLEVSERGN